MHRTYETSASLDREYLEKLADHEILSAEEERSLFMDYEAGVQAANLLDDPACSISGEEIEALQSTVLIGQMARRTIIESNQRLVISIARKYKTKAHTMTLEDLVQEGNLGLMRAVEQFDYRKGFKFSTYATSWIRRDIINGIGNKDRLIRLPLHQSQEIRTMRDAENRLRILGINPTDEQISEHSGLPVSKIKGLRESDVYAQPSSSIVYGDNQNQFATKEKLSEIEYDRVLEGLNAQYVVSCLQSVLSSREQEVFIRRRAYGETLSALSERYGVSVRQISNYDARARQKVKDINFDSGCRD